MVAAGPDDVHCCNRGTALHLAIIIVLRPWVALASA